MKFQIVVVMHNVEEMIEKNILLLKEQTYRNFRVIVVDDMSTDGTVDVVKKIIQGDDRFKLFLNKEKKYKTRNVAEAINKADAEDDDVFVLVDGDDHLANKNVLQYLYDVYHEKKCWMTYGSYTDMGGVMDGARSPKCYSYDEEVIQNNSFRDVRWLASHLKTFKYRLWQKLDMDVFYISNGEIKQALVRALLTLNFRRWFHWRGIKSEDLHDISGKYIRRIDDKAFTFPMLEMSGNRAFFISEVLYVYYTERLPYEDQNYGANKNEKWHNRLIRDILIHKERYLRVKNI